MQRIFLLWLMLIPKLNCRDRFLIWQWARRNQQFTCTLSFFRLPYWSKLLRQIIQQWYDQANWQAELMALQRYTYLTIMDKTYPQLLKALAQPPLVLFYQGDLTLLQREKLAVVGSRQIVKETQQLLQYYVSIWLTKQLVLVSGNATGVDCLVHQLTLKQRGGTIAVLGTGINHTYPSKNRQVQQAISQNGLVLSEYVLWAGPKRWQFPERNRIIVGLVQNVVISQAAIKSGTMVTADIALDENRNVWVLPLLMSQTPFLGNRQLVADGASILWHPLDLCD